MPLGNSPNREVWQDRAESSAFRTDAFMGAVTYGDAWLSRSAFRQGDPVDHAADGVLHHIRACS